MVPFHSCSQLPSAASPKLRGLAEAPHSRLVHSSFQQQLQSLTSGWKAPEREARGLLEVQALDDRGGSGKLTGRPAIADRPEDQCQPTLLQETCERSPRASEACGGKEHSEDSTSQEPPERGLDNGVWLEPMTRVLSALGPNPVTATQPRQWPEATLDRIALQLIRKVGLGAASVHVEFGQGVLAEGRLLVQMTDQGLEIALQVPVGVDPMELGSALSKRLELKGIRVSRIDVT